TNPSVLVDQTKSARDGLKTAHTDSGQASASLVEGEKNTTKDAKNTLKNELIDLLGIDIVKQYHNKNLLFDKYCDKMLKRRKSSMIINCDVLAQKGSTSLKVYREDGTIKVIANFKGRGGDLRSWISGKGVWTDIIRVEKVLDGLEGGLINQFVKEVENLDRLVANLCTIWIGSYHLQANSVRYQRERKTYDSQNSFKRNVGISFDSFKGNVGNYSNSFAYVLKSGKLVTETTGRELCGKTKLNEIICERFKVIIQGNVHWVRAKEMEGWDPLLCNEDYASSSSDEENEQENEGS
nr:RNA-directed DNA polymerase, eukaryota, nucleotide-binding alpha-beta plait domain protein [Tanacetum cinerariifolium]